MLVVLGDFRLTLLQIVAAIKSRQEERPLPETELIQCIWQGLILSVDWSARQDQNEALAIREITLRYASFHSHRYLILFSPELH